MRLIRLVPVLLLAGCSPVYVYKSAAGHAKLLWHRRGVDKALSDPRTPPDLREKLRVASQARGFAFARMHLKFSRDYSSYSPIAGPAVTYLVTGSRKTRFEPYLWRFPLAGAFPYKGHFQEKDALRERDRLERRGYDAYVSGAAAYNTPLCFADPLPSTALENPPGELAALIIHELAHGTVFFKSRIGFDEALATFIGQQGASEFLAEKYGSGSKELEDFRSFRGRERSFGAAVEELYERLERLYLGPGSEEEKLKGREEIFAWGKAHLKELGFSLDPLNNAAILAHRLYLADLDRFQAAYEFCGRDWLKAVSFFKSLDKKEPGEDLRRRLKCGECR